MDLQTSGGSIEARASSGNMRLHTSGGSIRLTDLRGDIDAQTSGGSVQGSDLTGEIKAGTSGGSVRLSNVSGSVDASTSAGTSSHLAARPLLSPDEAMRLPPDRQVLLRPGRAPALVRKLRHFADPEFAGLADG